MKNREFRLLGLASLLAVPCYFLGRLLLWLIESLSDLLFQGQAQALSHGILEHPSPWACFLPALGGLVVGLLARFGSPAVRGHGVPEVMESVLEQESKIPPKVGILKALASAVSIGSGGPFGAEGPVIGLGGALGSMLGQWLPVEVRERRILLASGAAAGVTAVFACPMAAAFLSLELLLFEFSVPALLAVGSASLVAAILRQYFLGSSPLFLMPALPIPGSGAFLFYVIGIGLPLGLGSNLLGRLIHALEGFYESLPVHWMWWPTLGGLGAGLIAYFEPRVLGPGYASISDTLNGSMALDAIALYLLFRVMAWSWALASCTAGGTLAPLFGIGAAAGALLCAGGAWLWPSLGLDPRIGALVGMGALFAGASRALFASILLCLETTQCYGPALSLLGACLVSTTVAEAMGPLSIMNAPLLRKGIQVPRHLFPGLRGE